jgi:hypothetical protein
MQTATVLDHQKCPEDTDCNKIVAFYVKMSAKRIHFLSCNKAFKQQSHIKLNKNNLPITLK